MYLLLYMSTPILCTRIILTCIISLCIGKLKFLSSSDALPEQKIKKDLSRRVSTINEQKLRNEATPSFTSNAGIVRVAQ